MSKHVADMLAHRRWCYWIPADGYVEGYGFRVSIVFEYEAGHYPSGDDAWLAGDHSKKKPWFWGHSYEEARKAAENINREKLGLSPRQAADIVTTSMSIKEKEDRL